MSATIQQEGSWKVRRKQQENSTESGRETGFLRFQVTNPIPGRQRLTDGHLFSYVFLRAVNLFQNNISLQDVIIAGAVVQLNDYL